MTEKFADAYISSLTAAIASTARPVTFTVAASSPQLAAGTFSIIIYNAGTDASPVNSERLIVTAVGGGGTSWTASTETNDTAKTHANGSTVRQILTARSITQQMADHVSIPDTPDPHQQYLREDTFTTKGDLLAGTASGLSRLARGTDGQSLVTDSSTSTGLKWSALSLSSVLTAVGDMIYASAVGVSARLALGAVNSILSSKANTAAIANPATTPTLAANATTGGTLVNGVTYYFMYAWSNGSPPAAGTTFPSNAAGLAATSTGRIDVTAPAAPAGTTQIIVYIGTSPFTLYQAASAAASTTLSNVVTISAPPNTGNANPNTINTTGGLAPGWITIASLLFSISGGNIFPVGANASDGTSSFAPHADHVHALGIITTRGDLIRSGAFGVAERVGLGTSGQVLSSNGTDAVWAAATGGTVFGASGGSHSTGAVPDPGAVAGTSKFLREDATWAIPPGSGSGSGKTTLLSQYTQATDLSVAVAATTWTDITGVNGSFTVLSSGDLVQFVLSGGGRVNLTSAGAASSAIRVVIDAAGTPINLMIGGAVSPSDGRTSPFVGSAFSAALIAGVHTWKLQVNLSAAGSLTLSASTTPDREFLGLAILEHGQAPLLTPASNLLFDLKVTTAQPTIPITIPTQAYKDLRIEVRARTTTSTTETSVLAQLNGDTGNNYDTQFTESSGTTSAVGGQSVTASSIRIGSASGGTAPSLTAGIAVAWIIGYSDGEFRKDVVGLFGNTVADSAANHRSDNLYGTWRNQAPVTSILLSLGTGSFDVGSTIRVLGEPVGAAGSSGGTGTRVRNSAAVALANATAVTVGFDTEDSDADNQHFTSAANLTGTVAKTAASPTLVGTTTAFTTELSVGQVISVPGTATEKAVVIGITDATHLTVSKPFVNSASGQTAARLNGPVVIRTAGNYAAAIGAYLDAMASGVLTMQIKLNDTTVIAEDTRAGVNAITGYSMSMQSKPLQTWDFLEVVLTQSSGGSINLRADDRSHFEVSARPIQIVAPPYALIRDEKAQNTNGGGFTSGSWQQRDLNTVVEDLTGMVTLASNAFTLGPGRYRIRGSAPAFYCSHHQTRVQNVTDTTTPIIGTAQEDTSSLSFGTSSRSEFEGVVFITAAKTFQVQHQCSTTRATDGLGRAANFTTEVYTLLRIEKIG